MEVYELTIEDMSTLGAMGSSPTVTETKLFANLENAQAYAEKDYGKPITWEHYTKRGWTSGDLMYVMYYIRIRTVN
jgi:hypothetical protein